MADQKKWFKVWSTILIDPHHSNLSLEDVGRWTRLGAMMVSVGEAGSIKITPPAKSFLTAMDCATLDDAKRVILRLPSVSIEEGQNDNGTFIVIMQNWFKYQVDSTAYERLKRSRCKRRGEEKRKRGEKKREELPPKPPVQFVKPTPEEVTAYAKSIGFSLNGQKFFDHYEARGWQYKRGSPMKNWKAAVRTWRGNDFGGTHASHERKSVFSSRFDPQLAVRHSENNPGLRAVGDLAAGSVLGGWRDRNVPEAHREKEPEKPGGAD